VAAHSERRAFHGRHSLAAAGEAEIGICRDDDAGVQLIWRNNSSSTRTQQSVANRLARPPAARRISSAPPHLGGYGSNRFVLRNFAVL